MLDTEYVGCRACQRFQNDWDSMERGIARKSRMHRHDRDREPLSPVREERLPESHGGQRELPLGLHNRALVALLSVPLGGWVSFCAGSLVMFPRDTWIASRQVGTEHIFNFIKYGK